ncbi:MAG: polyprenyl synthetase family protein [Wujia sp.]
MSYSTEDIEKIIYQYLPVCEGFNRPVLEAMNYSYRAGGKRIRPLMMKLCYDMFAGENGNVNLVGPFMSAIEMIHTYSLIHDDLPALDNDELRRGIPTCHMRFGEDIAILAGDGLLNYAYETAAKAFTISPGDIRVEKAFCLLASKPGIYGMIGGQTLDVVMSGKRITDEELEYIYANKTSALIECAMMTGALLAGADEESVKKLEQAARAIGMAFQVQDDILDVIGDETKLGKAVLSDEKNDKYTYVTIYGIDKAHQYVMEQSDRANNIINGLSVVDEEAEKELMELVNKLINRDR